ncbi:MAG: hypothetical protein U0936_21120 [Planctomycetaceae bacterium]
MTCALNIVQSPSFSPAEKHGLINATPDNGILLLQQDRVPAHCSGSLRFIHAAGVCLCPTLLRWK